MISRQRVTRRLEGVHDVLSRQSFILVQFSIERLLVGFEVDNCDTHAATEPNRWMMMQTLTKIIILQTWATHR